MLSEDFDFRSLHENMHERDRRRTTTAALISLAIHIVFLVLVSIYAVRNPEAIKQIYVQIISDELKPPAPKQKFKFRPTKISSELSSRVPSYSEFLPKLQNLPKSASPSGGTNLVGIKSEVALPYGEGLLRSAGSIPKVDSLSSVVYEMKKTMRFEPKIAEIAKTPAVTSSPPKDERAPLQLSIDFKDPTDIDLATPAIPTVDKIEPPKWITKVTPEYPEAARRTGIEGTVVLEVEVKSDGSLGEIKVVEALGYGCDEAAKEALKASKLAPVKRNGVAIDMWILIPYKFQLEK